MEKAYSSHSSRALNIVAIGGGNGLSTLLSGLKHFVDRDGRAALQIEDLTAVVAVSDDGGSSGRLRDELKMVAPGDIRNCIVALSEDSRMLAQLFQYRFEGDGALSGHSFGNLFLAALAEITGDFSIAVKLSSEILASKGQILPATTDDARLVAVLDNGDIIQGETNVAKVGSSIRELRLEPENCQPLPETLDAFSNADIISIGPGSLFTSLLPPLLVKSVANAIAESDAAKILVCNLMTQKGETDDLGAAEHIDAICRFAPEIEFDFVIVNSQRIGDSQAGAYSQGGSQQVSLPNAISHIGAAKIIRRELLREGAKVRHDPTRLAETLLSCASERRTINHEHELTSIAAN